MVSFAAILAVALHEIQRAQETHSTRFYWVEIMSIFLGRCAVKGIGDTACKAEIIVQLKSIEAKVMQWSVASSVMNCCH